MIGKKPWMLGNKLFKGQKVSSCDVNALHFFFHKKRWQMENNYLQAHEVLLENKKEQ